VVAVVWIVPEVLHEKAMTKAITDVFPNTTRRLCTKHLKDNVKHYLHNRVGVDSKERAEIIELLFGTEVLSTLMIQLTLKQRV